MPFLISSQGPTEVLARIQLLLEGIRQQISLLPQAFVSCLDLSFPSYENTETLVLLLACQRVGLSRRPGSTRLLQTESSTARSRVGRASGCHSGSIRPTRDTEDKVKVSRETGLWQLRTDGVCCVYIYICPGNREDGLQGFRGAASFKPYSCWCAHTQHKQWWLRHAEFHLLHDRRAVSCAGELPHSCPTGMGAKGEGASVYPVPANCPL